MSLLAGAGSTTAKNVSVTIKAPSGAVVQAATPVGFGGMFFGPLTLAEAGTYTISVNPPSYTTGSVDFQLWDVPADQTGTLTIGGGTQAAQLRDAGPERQPQLCRHQRPEGDPGRSARSP